MKEKHIK